MTDNGRGNEVVPWRQSIRAKHCYLKNRHSSVEVNLVIAMSLFPAVDERIQKVDEFIYQNHQREKEGNSAAHTFCMNCEIFFFASHIARYTYLTHYSQLVACGKCVLFKRRIKYVSM